MKITVSVYDEKHRELLKKNSTQYKIIESIDGKQIEISAEDFLIYSLFKEQKQHYGFRTYNDFKKKLPSRIGLFDDYLNLQSGTIMAKFNSAQDQQIVSEHVGIGSGLSVISHIHGLTEADWNIKPVSVRKDLDYKIASDGENIIEVECKGTFDDPSKKTSSVSNMRKHIEEKKVEQRRDKKNLLYGTITSYDEKENSFAHCRILDPSSENNYEDPRKLRILSRLNFYFREISSISKAHFLFALADRLQIFERLDIEEIEKLNNLELIKPNGESFEYPISYQYHKTRVSEFDCFADVMKIGKNQYLLYGFRDRIVDILIKQNYQSLLQLKFKTSSINTTVVAKLPKRAIEKGTPFQETEYGYFEQRLSGRVYATSAGRIFGILKNHTIIDE